ncbi:MAG: SPOR domain-containing protein [Magnetospirillum sp.]|nr:SPOR domain-containing protein [Magnetospirillum sp.]
MKKVSRVALTVLALGAMVALAACDTIGDSQEGADRAMSALARGDTANAENYALTALRKNPKDPYALLVAGLVYQTTGRYELARQYYWVIVSNRPQVSLMVPGDNGVMQPRPIIDVAQANIAVIDKITGRSTPHTSAQSGRAPGEMVALPPPTDAEDNLATRFRVLKRLLADDLVTPEEYAARRNANVGALLPYSSPPPAAGLDRAAPPDAEVVDRLRALTADVEHREMSPGEASAERTVILDGLLPAKPEATAVPPLPPKDVIAEAKLVGRLERFRGQGLISTEEEAREKTAMDRAMGGAAPAGATASGLRYAAPPDAGAPTALAPAAAAAGTAVQSAPAPGSWGVGLAWAGDERAGRKAWEGIKARFPEELGAKQAVVTKVALKGKRVRWRVVAGPFDSQDAAGGMCKTLKLHRQACDPTPFGGDAP